MIVHQLEENSWMILPRKFSFLWLINLSGWFVLGNHGDSWGQFCIAAVPSKNAEPVQWQDRVCSKYGLVEFLDQPGGCLPPRQDWLQGPQIDTWLGFLLNLVVEGSPHPFIRTDLRWPNQPTQRGQLWSTLEGALPTGKWTLNYFLSEEGDDGFPYLLSCTANLFLPPSGDRLLDINFVYFLMVFIFCFLNSILTSSGINASYGTSLPLDGFQAEVGRTNMRQHLLVTLVVVIQLLLIVRWR